MELSPANHAPPTPRLTRHYKIPFTTHELWFLTSFAVQVMSSPAQLQKQILELCVFSNMLYRFDKKLGARAENCKLKMTNGEVIALKRLLLSTPTLTGWENESSAILFKLDQLTVGIK